MPETYLHDSSVAGEARAILESARMLSDDELESWIMCDRVTFDRLRNWSALAAWMRVSLLLWEDDVYA